MLGRRDHISSMTAKDETECLRLYKCQSLLGININLLGNQITIGRTVKVIQNNRKLTNVTMAVLIYTQVKLLSTLLIPITFMHV
jgi:hypothetical protein